MSPNVSFRVGLTYFFSLVAFVVFASHQTSQVFPWLPLGLLGASVIVLALDSSFPYRILLAVAAACGFIAYIFWFAHPSLLNMDPDKVAVAVQRVIEFGGVEGLSDYAFYSAIPAFHVFVSSVGIVLGIPGKEAAILFGIVTPMIQVLGAATLVGRAYGERARTYAVVIAMVSTSVLYYAMAPIPQLSAVALWMPFLILFDKYVRTRSKAHLVGMLVTVSVLIFTHKLAMVLALGTVLSAGAIHVFKTRFTRDIGVFRPYVTMSILTGFMFSLQNFWLTTFGRAILTDKLDGLFDEEVGAPDPVDASSYLAVRPLPRIPEVIVGNGDWVLITALAGVCSLTLLRSSMRRLYRNTVLLGASVFVGMLMVAGYVAPDSSAPLRVLLFGTIPFAVVIGVALSGAAARLSGKTRHVATGVVMILVISQLFVTGAVPDHPYEPREYLTPQEIDGKEWANEHVTDEVHADFFYAREIVDFDRPDQTYVTGPGATARGYSTIMTSYLEGTVAQEGHAYVLYRTQYDIYQTQGAWRLTWDPESELDSTDNRVFDNGGAVLYDDPSQVNASAGAPS
ncbi:hypothetical protein ACFQE8_08130 [Salinirubellus sp. GCM10025818]|jgi:hypothetical protein|uniref:hypothetical protein n=1 Tax=Salinirubellus TaxID=2162630 RepID=UPI0030D5C4F5